MSETFGAVSIPLSAPVAGQPVDDPALFYFLSFLAAYTNSKCKAPWSSLFPNPNAPAASKIILSAYAYNPEECEFLNDFTPALFAWRSGINESWAADSWRMEETRVSLLWVLPFMLPQARATQMHPLLNAIAKVMRVGMEQGQDPSWVVSGDPDPTAATNGSVLVRWMQVAGRWPHIDRWSRTVIMIGENTYPAYSSTMTFSERHQLNGPQVQPIAAAAATISIKTPDEGFGDGGKVTNTLNL